MSFLFFKVCRFTIVFVDRHTHTYRPYTQVPCLLIRWKGSFVTNHVLLLIIYWYFCGYRSAHNNLFEMSDEDRKIPKRKRRPSLWKGCKHSKTEYLTNYFRVVQKDDKKTTANCTLCDTQLSITAGNNSNLSKQMNFVSSFLFIKLFCGFCCCCCHPI